jgi:hypothetical protein
LLCSSCLTPSLQPAPAIVMHEMFGLSFGEIAIILEKTPPAARQLASHARRRIQGTPLQSPRLWKDQAVVTSFLDYLGKGDIDGVMSVLHPNVIPRADAAAVPLQAYCSLPAKVRVAQETITNGPRAKLAQTALIEGKVGIVVAHTLS